MTDTPLSFDAGLAGLTGDDWLDQLEDVSDDLGFFEPLGPDHQVTFVEGGRNLIVTFEDAETIGRTPEAEPRGFHYAKARGWSALSVISMTESWFRHPAIYQFFDRLTDDGFFDGFDNVLFFGAGGAGYAAAAYSVASPGARVLAVRPQATLDPQVAGWDTRFLAQRRHSFVNRYGFAPDMIEAAAQGYVVFSPMQKADAIHASLFTRPNVTPLRVPGVGGRLEQALDAMGMLDQLIVAAMSGDLNVQSFARFKRALKGFATYQRGLFKRAVDAGHRQLAANMAAAVLRDGDDSFLRDALDKLARDGITPRQLDRVDAAE